ncbi:BON domain-containing protein [Deinococcus hopiensis]|uniref:Predicted periplasmic or secreted lipoprotein n=1 Tax=Deinococcus hopiensis KR-140 TaxID=695939 RepID=A0A1W1VRS9_9DEIO|nr:BON domain-containing protein [Deinococcus hopiensis]SMB95920.1 Predicted periplasmic or secreted lipoprotein [Deinococcus hopiensis KR-140]
MTRYRDDRRDDRYDDRGTQEGQYGRDDAQRGSFDRGDMGRGGIDRDDRSVRSGYGTQGYSGPKDDRQSSFSGNDRYGDPPYGQSGQSYGQDRMTQGSAQGGQGYGQSQGYRGQGYSGGDQMGQGVRGYPQNHQGQSHGYQAGFQNDSGGQFQLQGQGYGQGPDMSGQSVPGQGSYSQQYGQPYGQQGNTQVYTVRKQGMGGGQGQYSAGQMDGQYQGQQYQGGPPQQEGQFGEMSGTGSSFGQGQSYGQRGYGQQSGQSDFSTGSHRGKGPKGYQRSDDRVREMVSDALEDDHYLDASNIEVQVQGGEVTLMGTVTDRQQKRRAEDCLEGIRGVRDVHNQLRVQGQGQGQGQLGQSSVSSSFTQTNRAEQTGTPGAGGTVDRSGSVGYASSSDTPAGSLGSSVDSPHAESTTTTTAEQSGENR